jgi:hypothetical protein
MHKNSSSGFAAKSDSGRRNDSLQPLEARPALS